MANANSNKIYFALDTTRYGEKGYQVFYATSSTEYPIARQSLGRQPARTWPKNISELEELLKKVAVNQSNEKIIRRPSNFNYFYN